MNKTYNTHTIDILAQNALKYYDEELVSGEPQEIPIEELIEFHYGLIVQYKCITKNGTIHGLTVFEDSIIPVYDTKRKRYEANYAKEGTIIIDSGLLASNMNNRLRFTLAHELAHYIIHQDYYRELNELASKASTDSDVKTEREADSLAAALLMPSGRTKVAYNRLKNKLTIKATITQMAKLFNVSTIAMKIRLNTLGLV